MAMGMMGLFVIHPQATPARRRLDRDFALLLSEWKLRARCPPPDPNEMTDFNVLTFNGRVFPGTTPLVASSAIACASASATSAWTTTRSICTVISSPSGRTAGGAGGAAVAGDDD